jgi:LemA protein
MLLTSVLICVAALAILIAMPAYIAYATHNRLVALDQRCETAFGDIDAHLKHRHNLIPPLVETVRVFTKHESDILLGVTRARAEARQANSPEMRLSAEQNLTQNINALIGMAERFPELKASTHFSELRRTSSTPRTASPPRAASTIWRSRNTARRCANSPAAISAACST